MAKDSILVNLSDRAVKQRLMSEIGRLSGLYEILIKRRERTRSLDQNAYYWAAVAVPFTEWLREAYGDPLINKDQAHEVLKRTVLGMKKSTSERGITLEIVPDTRYMDTKEFNDYIEGCAKFLAEFCEIIVVPSDLFYEGATEPAKNP